MLIICESESFLRFYLFLREGGRAEDARETAICCLLYTPQPGMNLQHRHVPGIELATFCFEGWSPTNWATRLRAVLVWFLITRPHRGCQLQQEKGRKLQGHLQIRTWEASHTVPAPARVPHFWHTCPLCFTPRSLPTMGSFCFLTASSPL